MIDDPDSGWLMIDASYDKVQHHGSQDDRKVIQAHKPLVLSLSKDRVSESVCGST